MHRRIRVFHLEDYKIIRDGIRLLLSQDPEIELVGEAQHGEQLFKVINSTPIDILLLDIYLDSMENLDGPDGFEICKKVRRTAPGIKVIAHSVYDDADRVARILNAGAQGLFQKRLVIRSLPTPSRSYTRVRSIFARKLPGS